jgi:putative heme iron utilization protein
MVPTEPAPSPAERARTLVAAARSGALSTLARDPEGFPYGSLVTVAADSFGRPLLLLSSLAEHTQNLASRAQASVLVAASVPPGASPLAFGRVTLMGTCAKLDAEARDAARATFLAAHPDAAAYADFKDFAFHRLDPVALRYVGGFGRMSWITAADYLAAQPDPLAADAEGILSHMNVDHPDALVAYARGLSKIEDAQAATMTAVDRYGFEMTVTTPSGEQRARLAFVAAVSTPDEVRRAMVGLVKAARAAIG